VAPRLSQGSGPLEEPFATDPIWIGLGGILPSNSTSKNQPSAGAAQQALPNGLSFIFIDDDVTVLRERLRKLRLHQAYPLTLSRKRPSLAAHHRPRSTSQVPRTTGASSPPPVVIVHFTSLTNYKLVKEVIQSDLASHPGATSAIPEV